MLDTPAALRLPTLDVWPRKPKERPSCPYQSKISTEAPTATAGSSSAIPPRGFPATAGRRPPYPAGRLHEIAAGNQVSRPTTAALALHTAIYNPGLTLLVSPSLRQSKELFAKVTGFLKDLEPAEVLVPHALFDLFALPQRGIRSPPRRENAVVNRKAGSESGSRKTIKAPALWP